MSPESGRDPSSRETTRAHEDEEETSTSSSWWLPATALLVTVFVAAIGARLSPPLGIIFGLYAGYRAGQKSVPAQALGTGMYMLAVPYVFLGMVDAFLGALFFGFAAKRYAHWRHPQEAFRRQIPGAPGYYYNPAKVGLASRVVIFLLVLPFRSIPFAGRWIVKRLLRLLVGLDVEPAEFAENDIMYYLHRESPGCIYTDTGEAPLGDEDAAEITVEDGERAT